LRENLDVEEVVANDAATSELTDEPAAAAAGPIRRVVQARGLPETVLVLLMALWSYQFIRLSMLRYDRFHTFGFDLGIYDQGIWLLSRAKDPFVTLRGLEFFGHHANIALLLFVPFYRLGAGPIFLLVVQVLAQASGAIAVFLLARDLLHSKWAGVGLGGALLLNPTYQWLAWEFFHPDAMAIGPLLFAYWAARQRRWGWFWCAAVLTVLCKEDFALAVAVIGCLVFFRGERRQGAAVALGAVAYFLFATRVLITGQNGIGPFYDSFFGRLGRSPSEIAFNSVRHPGETWRLASAQDRRSWYWRIFAPWAFVPFLDLRALAIAGSAIFIDIVSSFPYTRDYRYHYSAIVVAGCAVATVEAIAWIAKRQRSGSTTRWLMVCVVLAAAAVSSYAWGCARYSRPYRGAWPIAADPRVGAKARAVKLVPPGAAASVDYDTDTHMTHREKIYEFPVPWCNVNWGVRGEHLDDPAAVQYLVIDRDTLGDPRDLALLADLLSHEFKVISEDQRVLVARRVNPPDVPLGPNPRVGECFPRPALDPFQLVQ